MHHAYRKPGTPVERVLERWRPEVMLGTVRIVGQLDPDDPHRELATSAVLDCMGRPMLGDPFVDGVAELDVFDAGMLVRTESGSAYRLGSPHPCVLHARRRR